MIFALGAGAFTLGVLLDSTSFFASMFAVLVTVAVVLFAERTLRPSLRITIEADPPRLPDGRIFLRLVIENTAIAWPLSLFLDRRPALFTRAWVTFLRENNQPVFRPGHRMVGRWSGTPEPQLIPISDSTKPGSSPVGYIRDVSALRDTIDIPPGERSLLDLVMRAPSNTDCMGWHNGIINRPIEPNDDEMFPLPEGRYHAFVRVETGGRPASALLRIVNDVPLNHFRLEPAPGVERILDAHQ